MTSSFFNSSTATGSRVTYAKAYVCPSDQSGMKGNATGTTTAYNLNSYNVNGEVYNTQTEPKCDVKPGANTKDWSVESIRGKSR